MVSTVIQRDGKKVPFNPDRIVDAITKAMEAANSEVNYTFAKAVAETVKYRGEDELSVEKIQQLVKYSLMDSAYKDAATQYIIYSHARNVERKLESKHVKTFNEIIEIEDNDIKNENANMNGNTPAGQMMKFASQVTKDYALNYLVNPAFAKAHESGRIHIHDLDYYPTKTTTCVQYDLNQLFKGGFDTGHGAIREPQSIRAYMSLAAIAFQTNQNEQHGGQSIPAFDHFMVPGVKKSFRKYFDKQLKRNGYLTTPELLEKEYGEICLSNDRLHEAYTKPFIQAVEDTSEESDQAAEAFIHNMNTMHSRGGNQVVFSSINYGTDDSPEARMVIKSLLKATEKGLGHGETPIFPIQIFKVKEGINFSEEDFNLAINNMEAALEGTLTYSTPNFDLFVRSCIVSTKRLFPNFVFCDATFNQNPLWKREDINRFKYEISTMGCRTRVYTNRHGEMTTWGRGNLSFTTINIVRLAIEAKLEAKAYYESAIKQNGYEKERQNIEAFAIQMFFDNLQISLDMTARQLYERYRFQCTAKAKQFPFLVGQGVWMGGEKLSPKERVEELLKHGSLSIGFIGLAEALKMLVGEHHGESEKAQGLGLDIVGAMRAACDGYSELYDLNFTLLATPAEGLAGRFTKIDKKEFGIIPGVTDREYYTNSNHIPVYFPMTAYDKIRLEAPYHALCNAGHITYVEMDAEAKKNPLAFMMLVKFMKDSDAGYVSINHPVDRCTICGQEGVIEETCPACGETEMIDRIRRITGYLTGTLDRWNSYKKAEERDRVKHGI